MARPKSWFDPKEHATAKKAARTREHRMYKFTRKTRSGGVEKGIYVGEKIPARLAKAEVQKIEI